LIPHGVALGLKRMSREDVNGAHQVVCARSTHHQQIIMQINRGSEGMIGLIVECATGSSSIETT